MPAIHSLFYVVTAACLVLSWGCASAPPGPGVSVVDGAAEADSLAAAGLEASSTGDYASAKSMFDAALDIDPTHLPALRGLAGLAEDTNDPVSAVYYYETLVECEDSGAEDQAGLAKALARAGRVKEAEERLETATNLYPNDAGLQASLGLLLIKQNRTKEAIPCLEKAVALGGPASREAHRALGRALFDRERYDDAVEMLETYDKLYPGDFDVNMELAFIYYDRGDNDDALPHYRAAVDVRPKSVDARVGLAKTLERLGRVDSAIRAYEKALETRGFTPEMEPVIIAQTNLLNKRGKYTRSLDLIERAGASFPETAGLACARGMALAGEGRYDEAVAAFSRASGDPKWSDYANEQIRRIEKLRRGR
jgi:tetratricopeptide (TPR) repeat protein